MEETPLDSGALSVPSESLRLVKGPSAWESEDSAGGTSLGEDFLDHFAEVLLALGEVFSFGTT